MAGRRAAEFWVAPCGIPGVVAVGATTRHSFPRHTHDQFGIGVLLAGAQRSRSGRGMVEAVAGDTITVNPGEVHDGTPVGDGARSWRILYLDPGLVARIVEEVGTAGGGAYNLTAPVLRDPRLGRDVAALFALATRDPAPRADAADAWEARLLALLARLADRGATRTGHGRDPAIAPALEMIADDPSAPLTLAALARACGSSRFQLLRAFTRATGLTPHAYLVQARLHLARRLIAGGEALAEAAAEAGFADQSHMTRAFVRRYGVSPGLYAAALR